MGLTDLPVSVADVRHAAQLLDGVIETTPLAHSRALSRMLGSEVYLKCENLQRAGSFKVRGAYVRMAQLSDEEKRRGVVAASAGNHAQGVALAAAKLGITARIYMPRGAALPKIAATQDHGAEVVLHGSNVDQALAEAQRYADETGAVFVHPFDHPDIIAGQGTLGLEILDQLPTVDTVIAGVGGGGLLAGVSVALKAKAQEQGKNIRVIGVQAENAAAYPPSLAGDAIVTLSKVSTIADGIAVGRPGQLPFNVIRHLADDVVTVSEDSLAQALIFMLERNKMVVEPAGAVGVAAILEGALKREYPDLGTTVVLLSGFRRSRQSITALLRALPDDAWDLRGHSAKGVEGTVRSLAEATAMHDYRVLRALDQTLDQTGAREGLAEIQTVHLDELLKLVPEHVDLGG